LETCIAFVSPRLPEQIKPRQSNMNTLPVPDVS